MWRSRQTFRPSGRQGIRQRKVGIAVNAIRNRASFGLGEISVAHEQSKAIANDATCTTAQPSRKQSKTHHGDTETRRARRKSGKNQWRSERLCLSSLGGKSSQHEKNFGKSNA